MGVLYYSIVFCRDTPPGVSAILCSAVGHPGRGVPTEFSDSVIFRLCRSDIAPDGAVIFLLAQKWYYIRPTLPAGNSTGASQ